MPSQQHPEQLELRAVAFSWGGRRDGAGRPKKRDAGVPHGTRPEHKARHPLHLTVRVRREAAWLRHSRVFEGVRAALRASSRDTFRILHYSVQRDHVHLVAEASDARALSAGMKGLGVRVARLVNRVLGRRGGVWADRYHARELTTPRSVRNALVYVLHNARKHGATLAWMDRCSSAAWFDGYRDDPLTAAVQPDVVAITAGAVRPVVAPRTWLAGVGWRRHGLLGIDESPRQGD